MPSNDVMIFVRQLLAGKSLDTGVRGTVTDIVKIATLDNSDPAVYLFQLDVAGFLYIDFGCTREAELQDIQIGDEIVAHTPPPETEAHPIFLLLSKPQPEKEPEEIEISEAIDTEKQWKNEDVAAFDPTARDEQRETAAVQ